MLKSKFKIIVSVVISISALTGCQKIIRQEIDTPKTTQKLTIPYQKFTLDNGLDVIFNIDKSDPIVSTAILYHVGSNREVKGKTGFAHLFEHMLFQESENVGQDQYFKKIQDAGGNLNGFTWNDGTMYFESVPNDSLETILWLEADRMGYFINTLDQEAFDNQKDVVQNEKRQRVDNVPYGHTEYIIGKNLYPESHPYNWQVIGELEDIRNATVEDVKEFYKKYYSPNNATLVVSGDFDPKEGEKLVKKYFGDIKKGETVTSLKPMNVTLDQTKKLYYEDNFATLPELTLVWPTVEEYNKYAYALNFLANLLGDSKKSPLYRVLVNDKKLTTGVSSYNSPMEIAGTMQISVRSFPDKNLTDVEKAVFESLDLFEKEGFSDQELEAVKAKIETNFYNGLSGIVQKSFKLANYNTFANDPGFIQKELKNIQAVTREDIMRVYNKYIKNKNYIATSFVPKGKTNLVAEGSIAYPIVEEKIVNEKPVVKNNSVKKAVAKTYSSFDRSKEPSKGKSPELKVPAIWTDKLSNGLNIYGIEQNELPLVNFSLVIQGGMTLEDPKKIGVSSLVAQMLKEGTKYKTPEELEEAIDLLGSSISVFSTKEGITINGNTLSRNYDKTIALVKELLLEPRWDSNELDKLKEKMINSIRESNTNPEAVARRVFNKIIFKDTILENNTYGTIDSINSITMDDLKSYYNNYFSPNISNFHVVGNINQDKAKKPLLSLNNEWMVKNVTLPEINPVNNLTKPKLYFVDIPKAKQSFIYIGELGLSQSDKDFYNATLANYKLGGSFSSNVNLILREEKGYTYGARTSFNGSRYKGPFIASASVKSNSTLDSVKIFKDQIENYNTNISEEDLAFTKNSLIKSNALRFESLGSLLGMLQNISNYKLPLDYIKREEEIARNSTLSGIKQTINQYIKPNELSYLVVGDAQTQLEPLKSLGLGDPIVLDIDGNSKIK